MKNIKFVHFPHDQCTIFFKIFEVIFESIYESSHDMMFMSFVQSATKQSTICYDYIYSPLLEQEKNKYEASLYEIYIPKSSFRDNYIHCCLHMVAISKAPLVLW